MDHRRLALLVTLVVPAVAWAAYPSTSKPAAPSFLVGTWTLQSRETHLMDGKLVTDPGLGPTPRGYLIYDTGGHVAAQLMRADRNPAELEHCGANVVSGPNTVSSICGYDAYVATYTVDEVSRTVTHHVELAINPSDVGHDVQRHYKLRGDSLTLSFETTGMDGKRVIRTLVWTRAPDATGATGAR